MSKLDFSTVLRDLHGESMREPKIDKAKGRVMTQPALDEKGREIMFQMGDRTLPMHESVMKNITAQDVAFMALTASSIKGDKVDGAEQIKRADIALRVLRGDTLSKEDQGLLERVVRDLELSTELKYAFSLFINEKPQVGQKAEAKLPSDPPAPAKPRASKAAANGDARATP